MGFDTIWTAFEGESSGYDKLKGANLAELYQVAEKARHCNSLFDDHRIPIPGQSSDNERV